MKRSKALWLGVIAAASVIGNANAALFININTDGNFSAAQLAVLNQAKADWLAKLSFNGGDHTIRMNFSVNNALPDDAQTSGYVFNAQGRCTAANIVVNAANHNWTTGAPSATGQDALDTIRHEMCHALGFTMAGANFAAKVLIDGISNRYYDLDRNGSFNAANDYDLIDTPGSAHSPLGSGDLMAPNTGDGIRNEISTKIASVLAQAYGFRVVPGPTVLAAFAGFALLRRRRRAAA